MDYCLPESLRNLQMMVISGEGGVWSAGKVGVGDGGRDSQSCQPSVCFCWLSWDGVSGDP